MTKNIIQYSLTILNNNLDSAWCGSTYIAHIISGDFIPFFLQRTSQCCHMFVVLHFG